jgi:hypothetical protein
MHFRRFWQKRFRVTKWKWRVHSRGLWQKKFKVIEWKWRMHFEGFYQRRFRTKSKWKVHFGRF